MLLLGSLQRPQGSRQDLARCQVFLQVLGYDRPGVLKAKEAVWTGYKESS